MDARDVPHIHNLIHQMAEFELFTDLFAATHELLASTLFPTPETAPFTSFTALILDLSPSSVPASSDTVSSRRLDLSASPLAELEAVAFPSTRGGGRVTAGFVICFRNYSTFLARPELYVEDIFVRAPWRRRGLGRMISSAVVGRAAWSGVCSNGTRTPWTSTRGWAPRCSSRGASAGSPAPPRAGPHDFVRHRRQGRVEWCVLDWNQNATDFYEGMGAEVFKQWRICRLTGAAAGWAA